MRAMGLLLAAVVACAGAACPGSPPPSSSSDAGDADGDAAAAPSDAAPPLPGLRAAYFVGYEDLALERIESTLDVEWGDGGPDGSGSGAVGTDRFSARWCGFLLAPASGT